MWGLSGRTGAARRRLQQLKGTLHLPWLPHLQIADVKGTPVVCCCENKGLIQARCLGPLGNVVAEWLSPERPFCRTCVPLRPPCHHSLYGSAGGDREVTTHPLLAAGGQSAPLTPPPVQGRLAAPPGAPPVWNDQKPGGPEHLGWAKWSLPRGLAGCSCSPDSGQLSVQMTHSGVLCVMGHRDQDPGGAGAGGGEAHATSALAPGLATGRSASVSQELGPRGPGSAERPFQGDRSFQDLPLGP